MNLSERQPAKKGFWRHVALFLLSRVNPHSKRILFLTSLYCRISHIDRMRDDVIDRLNGLLTLARRREALLFPAAVQELVWEDGSVENTLRDELTRHQFDEQRMKDLSERLVAIAPTTFYYDEPTRMAGDVFRMLQDFFQQHRQAELA